MSKEGVSIAHVVNEYDEHVKSSVARANQRLNNAMQLLGNIQAYFLEWQKLLEPSEPSTTKLAQAMSTEESLDEFLTTEKPENHFLPRVRQTPSTVVSFLAAVTAELCYSPEPVFLQWLSEALLNVDTTHRDLAEATLQVLTRIQSLLPRWRQQLPDEARVTNEIGYVLQSLLLDLGKQK